MKSENEIEISEEIPIHLLQKGIKITDKEVLENGYLTLEEIEGSLLNNKLIINAKGLLDGLRGEEDGITFFGTSDKSNDGAYYNDLILKIDPSYSPIIKNPHIFVIYYRRDLQKYYLDNFDENKEKYFIFVLLEHPFPINTGEEVLVSVLEYNFKLSVDKSTKNLIIEYGQGNNLERIKFAKEKTFNLIGRKTDCDLVINDQGFSREQSLIFFDKEKDCWFIKDGGRDKLSGTGTWLFVDKPFCLKNITKFKLGPSLMQIEFHKSDIY